MFEVGGRALTSPHLRPPALKPLLLPRDVRLHYLETCQAASWQQLGFWSEWFLSQTIKLVKMSHLVCKPLTTPSFLLIYVLSSSFFYLATLLSVSLPLTLSVSHSHSVPRLIGEWAHVVPILHVGSSPCLSLRRSFLLFYSLSRPRPPLLILWCIFTNSGSFFMAVLKGLLPEGSWDEERRAGSFPFATYLPSDELEEIRSPKDYNENNKFPVCTNTPAVSRGR